MIFDLDKPVKTKMFGNVYQKCGGWHNGRTTNYHAIIYCTDGEINMKIENDIFHLDPGDLLLIPAEKFYTPLVGTHCRYYFFNFTADTLPDNFEIPSYLTIFKHPHLTAGYGYSTIDDYTSGVKVDLYIKDAPYEIKSIFEKAGELHPDVSFSDQLSLDNLLRLLLVRMSVGEPTQRNSKITKILNYIHTHYAEEVSLSALARHFSLSESYIARLFREEVGCKPSSYAAGVRISVAKELLASTDLSMSEIAEKIGFSDVYYFSNSFKKATGVSPLQFRKQYIPKI